MRIKKMPFQFGVAGLMIYMEQIEKKFVLEYLSRFDTLPKYFGPFADCTGPVEFPYSMCQEHSETGVLVTARPDIILRKKNGEICLLDFKTSKPEGGGKEFLPQYEIQVIGYSWVSEQAGIGKVGTTGLVYCDVQRDVVLEDPMKYKTDAGIVVPFDFKMHEVDLDYSRLTKCLKEFNKLWKADRPPQGADKCKDCARLTRLIDFENNLRITDQRMYAAFPESRPFLISQDYFRRLTRYLPAELDDELTDNHWDHDGGMWANWDFS